MNKVPMTVAGEKSLREVLDGVSLAGMDPRVHSHNIVRSKNQVLQRHAMGGDEKKY